jgi:serine/threonine protein kinase/tetratricopeptide (TPR) repeat protein
MSSELIEPTDGHDLMDSAENRNAPKLDDETVQVDPALDSNSGSNSESAADQPTIMGAATDETRDDTQLGEAIAETPADDDDLDATITDDGTSLPADDPDATLLTEYDAEQDDATNQTIAMDATEAADAGDGTLIDSALDADDDATLLGDSAADDDATLLGDANDNDETLPGSFHDADDATLVGVDDSQSDATVVGDESQTDDRTLFANDPAAQENPTPSDQARYKLVDNFAKGGLGKIWKANDVRIQREVAYKELLPNALKNPNIVERFLEEAQITGQLEHPSIVPIYDLGWQDNGTPFYSMKLVRGSTYKEAIDACHQLEPESTERKLTFTRLLRNFIDVCNALAFAHERNVIHRDLKPLNIMLGDFGETLVLDWGLAKIIGTEEVFDNTVTQIDVGGRPASPDEDTVAGDDSQMDATIATQANENTDGEQTQQSISQTSSTQRPTVQTSVRSDASATVMGSIMGTPAYMPPEQAQGQLMDLDARSDNYSLGAILYEILCGKPPIPRAKLPKMLKHVVEGTIKSARSIVPTAPKSLDAVALKAMSKKKEDRYQSALELANEIEAYLADEPITAYEEPWHLKLRRWAKRHRTLVTSSAAVLFVTIIGSFAWNTIQSQRINGLQADAETKLEQAEQQVSDKNYAAAERLLSEADGGVENEPSLASLRKTIETQLARVDELRVGDLRADAESKMTAAERLANAKDYAAAERLLSEADGLIAKEPLLAAFRKTVETRLARVDELRIDGIRDAANDEILAAGRAVETQADYDAAAAFLGQAITRLENEPQKLAEQLKSAKEQLRVVQAAIDSRDAKVAAQQQFVKFQREVDQARFYGSTFTGDNIDEYSREAQSHANAAIAMYDLTDETPLDPTPPHLTEEQIKSLRNDAYELMLIMAQTDWTLGRAEQGKQRQASGDKAIGWIRAGRRFGIVSRAALMMEATYLEGLGKLDQRDAVAAAANETTPETALDFYLLGEFERRNHHYPQAIDFFRDALQVDPNHFWAMHFLALCHLQSHEPAAAITGYTACIGRRPKFPWNYSARGIAYAELKQFDSAMADFDRALKLQKDLYAVYINRGAVFNIQKRYDKAIADFQVAAIMRPDLAAPHINIGETYRQQADARRLMRFSSPRMGDPKVKVKVAAPPMGEGTFEMALAEMTKAIEKSPNVPRTYRIRADVQQRLGNVSAARQDYARSIELETSPLEVAESYKLIGISFHNESKKALQEKKSPQALELIAEALEAYDNSLAASDADTSVKRLRAEALLALNRDKEAIVGFTDYLKSGGKQVGDVYRARGLARAKLGLTRESMEDYTRALELEPSPNMLTRRGWAYLLKANKLALQDFDDAINANPEAADSYNGRGYAKVMLGDYNGAVADAEEAVKRASKQTEKQGALSWPLIYNASTIYAQAVGRIENDARVAPEQRQAAAKNWTTRAIQLIAQATKLGGAQYQPIVIQTLQTDEALNPIRNRPEFKASIKLPTPPQKKPAPKPKTSP